MRENRTINLVEVPFKGEGGLVWNRLHDERESICKELLDKSGPSFDSHRNVLQTRLRKIDDALDRLMAGSYGNCSNCGRAIDRSQLEIDPALALCLDCWGYEHPVSEVNETREAEVIEISEVVH